MFNAKGTEHSKQSPVAKCAYFLFSGATSALIALLSLLLIFTLLSLFMGGDIPMITIPEKIPNWGAAVILLAVYMIIVFPMKSLRYRLSPRKSYSLYGSRRSPKYGDATLWFAFFILLAWYASEHREGIRTSLGNFPDWWRNFVDTVGPWFYK
jgi:hypothetical protein